MNKKSLKFSDFFICSEFKVETFVAKLKLTT